MKKYVGVRVETIKNEDDLKRRQHHNYRKIKNKNISNEEGYYYLENNSFINEKKFNSIIRNKKFKNSEKEYFKNIEAVKSLNKNFHSKRTKPMAEAILYFSRGINEDFQNDKKLFFKKMFYFKKEFEKKYNTEITDFVVHTDEKGNVHSHFIFKNYNLESGKSLNFTKSKKNGSELQTLRGDFFSDYGQGYERGEIKNKPTKHLTVDEFKLYQDTQKENELLKIENKKLKIENKELKNQNQNLLNSINKNILNHYNDMKEFYNDLKILLEEESEIKFFKNLKRYYNGRRKIQLKKHINKMEGKLQKIKKKKQGSINNINIEEEGFSLQ